MCISDNRSRKLNLVEFFCLCALMLGLFGSFSLHVYIMISKVLFIIIAVCLHTCTYYMHFAAVLNFKRDAFHDIRSQKFENSQSYKFQEWLVFSTGHTCIIVFSAQVSQSFFLHQMQLHTHFYKIFN